MVSPTFAVILHREVVTVLPLSSGDAIPKSYWPSLTLHAMTFS